MELGKTASPRIRGNIVTQKAGCFYEKELENYRITEWLGTEGTSKDHKILCSSSLVELRNAYMQKLKATTISFNHWKTVGKTCFCLH